MRPRETLTAFDQFITDRGLYLEAVLIGGAALNLLGVISRPTKDCDILHPTLPPEIQEAAREFAAETRRRGDTLEDDWLNNGAADLVQHLPSGWQDRLQTIFTGSALFLRCLGRDDLLRSKLWALCDRGIDLPDCVALAPTPAELTAILPWLEQQDANPDWPDHARATLADVARRLGHAI